MDAIALVSNEITTAPQLSTDLFNQFVQWIDRGESTTRTYIINLRQFVCWMRYAMVTAPIRQDIINYREWLTAEHDAIELDGSGWQYRTDKAGNRVKVNCKPNTVKAYLHSVCQFFKWTGDNGYYPNIATNIHPPKVDNSGHKKDALTPAEVLKIEQSIAQQAQEHTAQAMQSSKDTAGKMQRSTEQGKRLFAMYLLATNCGLRTIELHRANIKDLQVKNGNAILMVWGKGHTEPDRREPIAQEVYEAIKDYLNSRTDNPTGTSPLFVSTGNRSTGKRIATTTISKMLKQAMKEAGFDSERLTAHSLRHSTGTTVQQITGDIYATQKYMRHNSPVTTEIYIHDGAEEEEKAQSIARQLYNTYHGIEADNGKEDLQRTINRLTPEQIAQLNSIAMAMAK